MGIWGSLHPSVGAWNWWGHMVCVWAVDIGWEPGIGGGHRVAVWGCGHQVVGVIGWDLGLWIIRCGVWAVGGQTVGVIGWGLGLGIIGLGLVSVRVRV